MSGFSKRLYELRVRKDLTQEELAKGVGTSRSAIANYEQGKRQPSFDMLDTIADFFNVDVDFLLGGERTTRILTSSQEQIVTIMDALNEQGCERLIEYAQLLLSSGEYKKHSQSELVAENA